MVRKIFIWGIALIALFIWFTQVFKSCQQTSNPLSKAKPTLEERSDAYDTSDEFEDEEDDTVDPTANESPAAYQDEDEDETDTATGLAERDSPSGTVATPTNVKPTATTTAARRGKYIVVGGTFSTQANANTELQRLQRLGYNDAEIFRFDYSDFYSVSVGRFDSYSQANARAGMLKKDGVENYIHKMRK